MCTVCHYVKFSDILYFQYFFEFSFCVEKENSTICVVTFYEVQGKRLNHVVKIKIRENSVQVNSVKMELLNLLQDFSVFHRYDSRFPCW